MGKNNLIISVVKNNLSEISNTLENIVELNYTHRHEKFNKHT